MGGQSGNRQQELPAHSGTNSRGGAWHNCRSRLGRDREQVLMGRLFIAIASRCSRRALRGNPRKFCCIAGWFHRTTATLERTFGAVIARAWIYPAGTKMGLGLGTEMRRQAVQDRCFAAYGPAHWRAGNLIRHADGRTVIRPVDGSLRAAAMGAGDARSGIPPVQHPVTIHGHLHSNAPGL